MQRGLVGEIIGRFETKGYKLAALKTRMATPELLDQHYNELVDKPFFPKLKEYMLSGPVSMRSDSTYLVELQLLPLLVPFANRSAA